MVTNLSHLWRLFEWLIPLAAGQLALPTSGETLPDSENWIGRSIMSSLCRPHDVMFQLGALIRYSTLHSEVLSAGTERTQAIRYPPVRVRETLFS
ncbi:hypothetical protein F5X97DRAFT_286290 [Nemania serpens]|nr:hypothetical protein F5X97DRAFT_286290 [Nemania serpens]